MFDKLIETEPEGANIHNRRGYFMASSIVVGILFITAVVISIYASDYGLGRDSFELSTIVAPPEILVDPKPIQPRSQANPSQSQSLVLLKPAFVAPILDPRSVPTTTTVDPNPFPTWTSPHPAPAGFDKPGDEFDRNAKGNGGGPGGLAVSTEPTEAAPIPEPPEVKNPVVTKPPVLRSEGPINGKATYLPKPPYPAPAIALNLQGKVDVQVMIDETGNVVSAKAVSGNLLFRAGAEKAAWNAKFSPTYLGKMPVKVTGVIVYNFTR